MAINGMMWVLFFLFIISLIISAIVIMSQTASNDSTSDMKSAIVTVTVINSIITVFLGGAAFFWTTQPDGMSFERPYMFLIVHAALLMSIIGVSVASLQKLDLTTTSSA